MNFPVWQLNTPQRKYKKKSNFKADILYLTRKKSKQKQKPERKGL